MHKTKSTLPKAPKVIIIQIKYTELTKRDVYQVADFILFFLVKSRQTSRQFSFNIKKRFLSSSDALETLHILFSKNFKIL